MVTRYEDNLLLAIVFLVSGGDCSLMMDIGADISYGCSRFWISLCDCDIGR